MGRQFKNKEELDKWIMEKDAALYPLEERSQWDIEPCKMSDSDIVNALIEDGYTDLFNLVENGDAYEIDRYTNAREEK